MELIARKDNPVYAAIPDTSDRRIHGDDI